MNIFDNIRVQIGDYIDGFYPDEQYEIYKAVTSLPGFDIRKDDFIRLIVRFVTRL